MTPAQITPEMTLFEVTERYPETIPVLVDQGFSHVADPARRASHGKMVTLSQAAQMRGKDLDALLASLGGAVSAVRSSVDLTLQTADDGRVFPASGDIRVAGLVPCPVRLPLLEAFDAARLEVERKHGVTVGHRLAAASIGMDAVQKEMDQLRDEADLPHVFVSAGFEAFFDRRNLARFKDRGVFVDRSPRGVNADFAGLDLKDPDGHYAMIAVVAAVFLVDKAQLAEGEEIPRSWADVLSPRLARRVALPVGDFDLFNGILLTTWKRHGDEGVRALARSLLRSQHPSQAAGRFKAGRGEAPLVSVIPYFFSRMARLNPGVEVVWPQDGAVISPIFLLERRDAPPAARELADFFFSRATGEILSHRGLFPSLLPEVTNELPAGATWQWLGWDTIREHDLGELIPRLAGLFQEATGGEG